MRSGLDISGLLLALAHRRQLGRHALHRPRLLGFWRHGSRLLSFFGFRHGDLFLDYIFSAMLVENINIKFH